MNDSHINIAIKASIAGGKGIMDVFNSEDFGVRLKGDDSPLTEADLKSHNIIESFLKATDYPVLSEEGTQLTYGERRDWDTLWIVDPLDGTKEFIKRSGEFTVNIALIKNNMPVLGVVFAPVLGWLYWGDESGAYKAELQSSWLSDDVDLIMKSLNGTRLPLTSTEQMTVVASVSHFSKETQNYVVALEGKVGEVRLASRGSSLKVCLVAEGSADLYPRLGPTMEWDTAAGQAVVEASGGQLFDWKTKRPMMYNREDLLNGWFLATTKGIDLNDYWLI